MKSEKSIRHTPEKYFRTRKDWRKWLEQNHASSDGIWMICYKKGSGRKGIKYEEAVEEALCFGWIDSRLKRINDDYFIQHYTPRRKGSRWSKYNLERAEALLKKDLMAPAGKIEYEKALADPKRIYENRYDGEPLIPEDLLQALMKNPVAYENFSRFPVSGRRIYISWLNDARREETRLKRINKIVLFSAENRKPGML